MARYSMSAPDCMECAGISTTIDCDVVKFEGLRTLKYSVKRHAFGAYSFSIPHAVTSGSAGYLICKAAALKFANQRVIDMPVDDLLDDDRLALRIMEVEPRPIWQDNQTFTSQNSPTRTLTRDSKLKRLVTLIKKKQKHDKGSRFGCRLIYCSSKVCEHCRYKELGRRRCWRTSALRPSPI